MRKRLPASDLEREIYWHEAHAVSAIVTWLIIYPKSEPGTLSPNGFSVVAFIVLDFDINYIERTYQENQT
jgi:hypothetical protein